MWQSSLTVPENYADHPNIRALCQKKAGRDLDGVNKYLLREMVPCLNIHHYNWTTMQIWLHVHIVCIQVKQVVWHCTINSSIHLILISIVLSRKNQQTHTPNLHKFCNGRYRNSHLVTIIMMVEDMNASYYRNYTWCVRVVIGVIMRRALVFKTTEGVPRSSRHHMLGPNRSSQKWQELSEVAGAPKSGRSSIE